MGAGDEGGFPAVGGRGVQGFDALGVLAPPLTRDAYSLDQFLAELVEPSDAVWVVRVHKRRQLGQQTLTVGDRGLRHGLLVHRFGT